MNELLHLVLSLSLGGSLMALLLLGLRLLLRSKLPSAFYYYAWTLVLLRLVLPLPGFISLGGQAEPAAADSAYIAPVSAGSVRVPNVSRLPNAENPGYAEPVYYTAAGQAEQTAEQTAAVSPAGEESPAGAEAAPLRLLAGAALGMALSFTGSLIRSGSIWFWLWGIGMVFTLVWYIAGYRRFYRALKRTLCRADLFERHLFLSMGGPKRLGLYRSSAVSTPMLLGLWKPILVLPDRIYSEEMLRNILNHELTHYRRRDLIFKWLAVVVSAIHWFNPIVHIVRRELDRACEMSCDEKLLRSMDKTDKQSYGETLLSLAADSALPRRLVATTFATEKRNLRERLEQIMTYKHMGRTTLALMLVVALLLAGCATAVGPQSSAGPEESPAPTETPAPEATEAPVPTPEPKNVTVSTVDELLAAIGSYTNITLLEGEYNLAEASDYGERTDGKPYHWTGTYNLPGESDAYELMISGVDCLTLMAEGEVTISAVPRYANVLYWDDCTDICLAGLTIGHTEAPGECTGGVVKLNRVDNAIISQCRLFGCGTVGVDANSCTGLRVVESEIYDCSYSAAWLNTCQNVLFNNCKIHDNTNFIDLFQVTSSDNCAIINCQITNNKSNSLLYTCYSPNVYFAGNEVTGNDFSANGMFYITGTAVTVEGSQFSGNRGPWYAETYTGNAVIPAVNSEGKELEASDFETMELVSVDSWEAVIAQPAAVSKSEDGSVHVSTVDEFLAAIGSDTTIYLEDGIFNLSTANGYGGYGGENYVWYDTYVDGPQLVISGVSNLSIIGGGADKASIVAVPRYAEVLAFENCHNIRLEGFTAGHTQAPGSCVGGVVYFASSTQLSIENCSLFGCGVWGVTTNDCDGLTVKNTEIYDCSNGDLNLSQSHNISFENCNIHDNGPNRVVQGCTKATIDGQELVSIYPPQPEDLNAQTVDMNVYLSHAQPTLYINYMFSPVTELTLPIGTPIELFARRWGNGADPSEDLEVKWSINGSGCELTERKHGKCVLENTSGKSGSVTVTAETGGQKASIKVNLTAAQPGNNTASGPEDPFINLMYYDTKLKDEITLTVGDSVTLNAALAKGTSGNVTWSCDKEQLKLSPNGASCTLEALEAVKGGVTLTASCDSVTTELKVYIISNS